MQNLLLQLKLGGSTVALVAAASFAATAAMAQSDTSAAPPIESVIVTGTNISGVSGAVGENVISMDAADLQITSGNDLTDVLRSNPALGNFNANAQGLHESDFFEVNIHGIGGSSSASTLEIIDGMRMPLGGTQHSEPDSGILPAIAVQRLDILSDGASSIYGADALAGVVNFITRESFDGVEFDNTMGYGRDYNTWNSQFMWGTHWDNGNMYIAYQHSYQSDINLSTRLSNANFIPQGGLNEDSFNCSPAAIQPAGTSLIYPSATSTSPTSTAQANAPCFIPGDTDYVPKDTRDNFLIKATQQFGSRLTVQSTTLFAVRKDVSYSDGGTDLGGLVGGSTMTATAFETGPQANPFYVNPPGVTATQQTVYFNFTGLLPVARSEDGDTDIYEHLRADYKLTSDWTVTGEVVVTQDIASTLSYGMVCPTCALEGLNGTTNSSGNLTTPSIPGTTVIATTLPLTTANALDVWDPVGSNKTSAAELANISGTQTSSNNVDTIEQYVLSVNGTLFQVPAGPLKIAIGGQLFDNTLIEEAQGASGIGETSYGSAYNNYHFSRVVESAWVEANIPVISPSMNIPLVEKLDFDVAGRYDHYTILGPTSNPKFALDWQVFQGLKLRGSYSTSFVAPQLDSIGDPSQGYNYGSSTAGATSGVITFPTKLWPGTAGVLPGCAATATTCQIGTSTLQGILTAQGMGANAKPATGNGYTLGADYSPSFVPGMLINLTLWDTHEKGAVQTINNQAEFFDVDTLNQYAAIYPTGATAAQIAADVANHPRLNSPLPTTVYYYINNEQRNVEDFQVKGIDAALNWDFDTSFGHFTIGDNVTYLLQYGIAYGFPTPSQYFNVLNSSGFTSQFDQIQLQSRTHVGWTLGNLALDVFMNYIGPYRNLSSTAANPASVPILTGGSIITGGDHVNSSETFDMHLAYNIPDGFLGGDQVFVNGQNIFDTKPPFYSSAMGYDDYAGSLIGRVMSLGLRARF